jgi:NDP-mannose synthase
MKAVILAGGLGTRLKPFTEVIPKSLLPIGESSVLEIQILSLVKHGVDQVYVATNYRSEYVQAFLGDGAKYGVSVAFSREEEPLGTCGPVGLLRDKLHEPFLLMNGDILTTLDFSKAYAYAMGLDADLVVVTTELVTPFHFGKVISDGTYITEMQEKPDITLEILSGIYILKPPVFDLIPRNTYYGIDNLIKDMLARRMKVGKYLMKEYWLDIGRIADYQVAQDAYREHFTDLSTNTP